SSLGSGRAVNSSSRPAEGRVVHDQRGVQRELRRLAEEQAALHRVATLVARQAAATEIFALVAEEVARLFRADTGTVCHYDSDESMTAVATWGDAARLIPVGTSFALDDASVAARVQRSRGPCRCDNYDDLSGPIVALAKDLGTRGTIGAPIVVGARVWGVVLASTNGAVPFPDDSETRLLRFAELAATAISNAVSLAELAASRARIVATADETRRRIQRDLHDGAQQRLVSLALELRTAQSKVPAELSALRAELAQMAGELAAAVE